MAKKLNNLTQAQIDVMPKYVEKWVAIGLSTERVDFEKVKLLVAMCYEKAGYKVPSFHFAQGPDEGYETYLSLGGKPGRSEYTSGCMFGSMEASWLSYYDYYKNETDIEIDNIDHMKELVMSSGWVYLDDTDAIIHDRSTIIARDEQGRLHSETGPAVQYGDGWKRYFRHGNCITCKTVIEPPCNVPMKHIVDEVWYKFAFQNKNLIWNKCSGKVRNKINGEIRQKVWVNIWNHVGLQIFSNM